MILFSARTIELVGSIWWRYMKSPWIDQKSFRASASPFVSSGWNSSLSPWDSPLRFSLLTVGSRLRVGSWNSQFLPDNFAEPSAIGDTNCSSLWVIRTSFAFSLLGYVSDASNFSNSSISAVSFCSSQIHPRSKHILERFFVIIALQIDEFVLCLSLGVLGDIQSNASNNITGPLNDSPNLRSFWDFPSARKSWTFCR